MRYHLIAPMLRRVLPLVLAVALFAFDGFRLYLKDGGFHMVNEYKVLEDRVRYYSTERAEWEEIPLDMVDLKKTESERTAKVDAEKAQAADQAAEDAFEKDLKREIAMIPPEPGAYTVIEKNLRTFKPAEIKMQNDKKRSVLKAISPIPLVAGKSTLEIDGEHSPQIVTDPRPYFYLRLAQEERFGIVRCSVKKKGVRLLETLNIIPVSNEIISDRDSVDIFRQMVAPGLFKIWPTKPLEPGEYAVIEFSEGSGNTQAWDFRVQPAP
jgi:hypothetical protein